MIKSLFHISCFICCLSSAAQTNLIFNGDFEQYDSCPTGPSTITNSQLDNCLGWNSPTLGTSDYYNICDTFNGVSTPLNISGYQYPFSGFAYSGISVVYLNTSNSGGLGAEYLQGNLIEELSRGREYSFSFKVSLSDFLSHYAVWQIGAFFSDYPVQLNTDLPLLQFQPQVISSPNSFLADTAEWVIISGTFVANGGEKFVIIGAFFELNNLDTLVVNFDQPFPGMFGSYYYIDDVVLLETESSCGYNVFTPNNDGLNDQLMFCLENGETVKVYNRWGTPVFHSNFSSAFWDGRTTSGSECESGVYFIVVEGSERPKRNGFVHLVR